MVEVRGGVAAGDVLVGVLRRRRRSAWSASLVAVAAGLVAVLVGVGVGVLAVAAVVGFRVGVEDAGFGVAVVGLDCPASVTMMKVLKSRSGRKRSKQTDGARDGEPGQRDANQAAVVDRRHDGTPK